MIVYIWSTVEKEKNSKNARTFFTNSFVRKFFPAAFLNFIDTASSSKSARYKF
jgi:hypothetical protein